MPVISEIDFTFMPFLSSFYIILIDPYIGEAKSGDLAGIYCCEIYYNKTNYELAYTLVEKPTETIVIVLAGTLVRRTKTLDETIKMKPPK